LRALLCDLCAALKEADLADQAFAAVEEASDFAVRQAGTRAEVENALALDGGERGEEGHGSKKIGLR